MSEEIMSASSLLTANADLRAALEVAMQENEGRIALERQTQADAAALRVALKWYGDLTYSHKMGLPPDVQFIAEAALEATSAGAALLVELDAARKVVDVVRWAVKNHYAPPPLYDALVAYDTALKDV